MPLADWSAADRPHRSVLSLARLLMNRRRLVLVAAILGAIGMILFITAGNPEFHARSRLKMETREGHFYPNFARDESQAISNFLSSSESRLLLAKTSRIDEKNFVLERIGPIRGTSLFYINYSGADSNSVQSVASNAANMVVSFYITNQPSWDVTYCDSFSFRPISSLQQLEESVASFWRGFKDCVSW
jgi:hypothetical protein